MAALVKSENQ